MANLLTDAAWWQVGITAFALGAAAVAVRVAWLTYRASYRPLLRPAPLWDRSTDPARWIDDWIVLKNVGRGSAISVVVLAANNATNSAALVGEVDAIEPLGALHGPHFLESSRVGRVEIPLVNVLVRGHAYRILYQDVAAAWHETEFSVEPSGKFKTRLQGRLRKRKVPPWVKDRAQVVGES